MKYLFILLIPIFLFLLYTDIKWRRVHLVALLAAFTLSIFRLFYSVPAHMAVNTLLLNILILGIISSILLIYTRFRKIQLNKAMAIGDFMLLGIAAINLSPISFILFLIVSSVTGTLYFFAGRILYSKQRTIPYAGLMAALLVPVVLYDIFSEETLYGDMLFFKFFMQ